MQNAPHTMPSSEMCNQSSFMYNFLFSKLFYFGPSYLVKDLITRSVFPRIATDSTKSKDSTCLAVLAVNQNFTGVKHIQN